MKFETANDLDIETIFDLYNKAIEFQKQVFDKHWLGFDSEMVGREIAENRLWKITEGDDIACIFSVAYEDPIIWGEDSGKSAMYIHRIVTNPNFRGRGYARIITEWAKEHASEKGLRFVRMDTWEITGSSRITTKAAVLSTKVWLHLQNRKRFQSITAGSPSDYSKLKSVSIFKTWPLFRYRNVQEGP